MKPIKDIYRIGYGPSSSHTIAPQRACLFYRRQIGECDSYKIELCGSLALTGKGHRTDGIIEETLGGAKCSFEFNVANLANQMLITGFRNGKAQPTWTVLSLGGGSVRIDAYDCGDETDIYEENSFVEINQSITQRQCSLIEYLLSKEPDLKQSLAESLDVMLESVKRGIQNEGLLNKDLNVYRSAKALYEKAESKEDYLTAYAYAVGEENAAGHKVCTAPTLGSAGIVGALMAYHSFNLQTPKEKLIEALMVGGLFGNLIKENASIAGSVGGCQAEVGTACSMTAAMIAYMDHASLDVIERAAEIGVEHHLGLTCDPVKGYVIIPCIERNAAAILRAFDAYYLAKRLDSIGKKNLVSFDMVVASMNYTGKKLAVELRETGLGGLALEFPDDK